MTDKLITLVNDWWGGIKKAHGRCDKLVNVTPRTKEKSIKTQRQRNI